MKLMIVGAGPAGVTVAETVRRHDARAEIIMVSQEPFAPYAPPALVEHCLTGSEIHFWKGNDFAVRLGLDYRAGTRVAAVKPDRHTVLLGNGEALAYDRLVLATGARADTPIEGADKPGVYDFKSLASAEDLMKEVRGGRVRRAVVVGAGFIGLEVALLLADLGVTVIQLVRSRVMRAMLDTETSDIVLEMMRERGIEPRLNVRPRAFLGHPRAQAVELDSGEVIAADILVAAVGLKPNTEFLRGSGIKTKSGIVVDDHLRTNLPDVYALGDVAETADRVTGKLDVHYNFPNAVAQGEVVAGNLLGWDMSYQGADRMNSLKHLGLPVIAAGEMEGEELRARHGRTLRKLYISDGRIVGFRLAGDIKSAGIYRTLMNRRVNVESFKHRLLEPGFGMGYIEELAASGTEALAQ